jgi:Icc-related predicted phosphoesterase
MPATSVDLIHGSGTAVFSGSARMNDIMSQAKYQQQTLIQLHGHTHESPGQYRFVHYDVANVGPLRHGRFGIFTFKYSTVINRWYIGSSEFLTLPPTMCIDADK